MAYSPVEAGARFRHVGFYRTEADYVATVAEFPRAALAAGEAALAFVNAHAGHVRYVGELIWAARGPAERREIIRHEALINLAFADADAETLWPYGVAELDPAVIRDAKRTHPLLLSSGRRLMSPE